MRRGPKPLPPELRRIRGERQGRTGPAAPRAAAGAPECPAHLDAEARAEWDRVTAELAQLGVLSRADRAALALYCDCHSQWVAANRAVAEKGLVVETRLGGVKANPAVAIARAARAQMIRVLAEFGLTPSARTTLGTAAAPEGPRDELGEFLMRHERG